MTFEIRLIKEAGIFAIRLNIRACALSREALSCFVKWNRWRLHRPLLHTNALWYSHFFRRLIGDTQTRLYRSIRPYIVPMFPATSNFAESKHLPYKMPNVFASSSTLNAIPSGWRILHCTPGVPEITTATDLSMLASNPYIRPSKM